jgi:hypothetical protein
MVSGSSVETGCSVREAEGTRIGRRWRSYSWAVRAYLAIGMVVWCGQLVLLLPGFQWLAEAVSPVLGGGVIPLVLFLVTLQLITPGSGRKRMIVSWMLLTLGLGYAVVDTWLGMKHSDATSPWIRHSRWRPVWDFGAPLFGMLLLSMPKARRAMRNEDAL